MSTDPFAPETPTPGAVIRKTREQRRMSVRQMAQLAGLSAGFLMRVEQDVANPTWKTIQALAAALQSEALLYLVADEAAVAGAAALVAHESPLRRLLRQRVSVLYPLSLLVKFQVPFVLTGAAAALIRGFPTPVSDLNVFVLDDDVALEALQEMLLDRSPVHGARA